eukprot:3502734-Rhodomonas_salina.1
MPSHKVSYGKSRAGIPRGPSAPGRLAVRSRADWRPARATSACGRVHSVCAESERVCTACERSQREGAHSACAE